MSETRFRVRWFAAGTLFGCVGLLAAPPSRADDPPRPEKLLTVRPGGLPIILTASHGGREPIPGAPVRTGAGVSKFATARDENTAELAERVAAELGQRLNGRPYLVAARFERKYADANRPAADAYESNRAKPYYDAYHQAVRAACRDVRAAWGHGLLLDLHGQAAEAGAVFRGTNDFKSVTLLCDRFGKAAVVGPRSILGQLAAKGYAVIPANNSGDPEDRRYNGGYTVRTYGSHQGTGVEAIQLELGSKFRAKGRLDQTATELADAVQVFAAEYLPRTKKAAAPAPAGRLGS
jgi:N-formylglutamate amidohydrolase